MDRLNESINKLLIPDTIIIPTPNYKKIIMDDGKVIEIFDNFLPNYKFELFTEFHKKIIYKKMVNGEELCLYDETFKSPIDIPEDIWDESLFPENLKQSLSGLYRWYGASYSSSYDMNAIGYHIDDHLFKTKTLIYYCHDVWDYRWGAEVLFLNLDLTYGYSVLPMPNRLIAFDSTIIHTVSKSKQKDNKTYGMVTLYTTEERSKIYNK